MLHGEGPKCFKIHLSNCFVAKQFKKRTLSRVSRDDADVSGTSVDLKLKLASLNKEDIELFVVYDALELVPSIPREHAAIGNSSREEMSTFMPNNE